jgi:ribonuclease VapC
VVLDTSAVLAVLLDEPESEAFVRAIAAADICRLSVAGFVEASMVLHGRSGAEAVRRLDLLIHRAGVVVTPVSADQGLAARDAFARYGKGRHPAGLNFGDCFSYALAKDVDEPLLFKGDDFAKTDVERWEPAR